MQAKWAWCADEFEDNGPSFSLLVLVLGLPHVTLIELRLGLILYQDYRMVLLTLAGHFPTQLYVREARRMVGARVLTWHDATNVTRAHGVGPSCTTTILGHLSRSLPN